MVGRFSACAGICSSPRTPQNATIDAWAPAMLTPDLAPTLVFWLMTG